MLLFGVRSLTGVLPTSGAVCPVHSIEDRLVPYGVGARRTSTLERWGCRLSVTVASGAVVECKRYI